MRKARDLTQSDTPNTVAAQEYYDKHRHDIRPQAEPPKGCAYHSFRETCSHCGHPEYCPAYGSPR